MDIEIIINLIIIIAIVLSVLKRLQDVSKKSEEIKKPQRRPPAKPTATRTAPTAQQSGAPDTAGRPGGEPMKQRPRSIIEELIKELQPVPETRPATTAEAPEAADEPSVFGEDTWEMKDKEFAASAFESRGTDNEFREPGTGERALSIEERAHIGLKLDFTGPDLVRGIVMREILGPPVSLRERDGY